MSVKSILGPVGPGTASCCTVSLHTFQMLGRVSRCENRSLEKRRNPVLSCFKRPPARARGPPWRESGRERQVHPIVRHGRESGTRGFVSWHSQWLMAYVKKAAWQKSVSFRGSQCMVHVAIRYSATDRLLAFGNILLPVHRVRMQGVRCCNTASYRLSGALLAKACHGVCPPP